MRINITKTGYRTKTAEVNEGATVRDAIGAVRANTEGYAIRVNSLEADMGTRLNKGDTVQLVAKIKGGADINVKVVKFGTSTKSVELKEGSSIRDALRVAKYGQDGFTLSLNGAPAQLNSPVNDGDIVQLVPKVKGGN